MTHPKKLIEVSLPLDVINDASAYDKMPGIGPHPKGIHHWWARLPLPTARAVLFASVVNDPETDPRFAGATAEAIEAERERLHGIIRRMMQPRLHEKPEVYEEARAEMAKHCEGQLPTVLDPFSGGGSIPLEAQRLGFPAVASDLNPVAVMINKAQLEIVPRWLDHPPVNPDDAAQIQGSWQGATGLAKDVAWYGEQIRKKAIKEIGQLYPKVKLPKDLGGQKAEVIAWIWARTVRSPDPTVGGTHVPLLTTYWLCSKKGKLAYLEPYIEPEKNQVRFKILHGTPKDSDVVKSGTKEGRGSNFTCLLSGSTISASYIKEEGCAGKMGFQLVAVVADGGRKRVYVDTPQEHESIAFSAQPTWSPDGEISSDRRAFYTPLYGLNEYRDLFTKRQLFTMGFLCDAIAENRGQVLADAKNTGLSEAQAEEYAKAVTTFLAFAVDRSADFNNSLCGWGASNEKPMHLFGRQAIPMVWDFAEGNLLGTSVGSYQTCMEYVTKCIQTITRRKDAVSRTQQQDAVAAVNSVEGPLLVSTDPPYYDNIGYAALSDFFYVWLRKNLAALYPEVFSTVLVPKGPELTAAAERHDGDKQAAKEHFENGFRQAFTNLRARMDPRFPLTVYYAFKQSDEQAGAEDDERVNLTTGWETLLEALNASGFQITATVPVRASQQWRMRAMGSNALASYIVLACRPRSPEAPTASRRDFLRELRQRLPSAVETLQKANIAPVDLAQAALGPGMAVFSSFGRVLENEGGEMSVRAALRVINQVLSECLEEQESEFDSDTRWAVAWFRQYGYEAGPFGDAEGLARAQAVSVKGLQDGGILQASASKVRLLKPDELPVNWNPATDKRLSLWEATGHLTRALKQGGEVDAARILKDLRDVDAGLAEACRELAYLLFQISESKRWPAEALPFNALVVSWPSIVNQLNDLPRVSNQTELDLN
ncbi:MAG: DUF1156 domain-containing protein [Verrucomicrobia bacterium]|nr:DUF1156 domain-containing protein [Verrucomicrobiota bacterium]MCH8512260.1 DUF1156 domain-containing protein [Kiritimatiellia bacterium]